ncbi:MAG: hypothetical protein COT16_02875 [Elusimicrobia bacterium CG08_land_8_20_14_0_20_44_26]|nr:MAG: hypothetical protein COT16_02875 [Elusimicrobia bacterium CG08_land_8_20_14_0_20_44_26]
MHFTENGRIKMNVFYNDKTDLLYLRLDNKNQEIINKRISDEIVIEIGKNNRIVGIEILAASKHVNLQNLFPVKYKISKEPVFAGV